MGGCFASDVLLFWLVLTCCFRQIVAPGGGNDCSDDEPCQNGGTCKSDNKCECVAGWKHHHCENVDHDCDPDPCLNGGTCADLGGSVKEFQCTCVSGYTGDRCENGSPSDSCSSSPCQNEGSCNLDGNGGYTCGCTNGYSGTHCEHNSCRSNPCDNGGLCNLQGDGGYTCECAGGYSGTHCENGIDPACDPPCVSGNCKTNSNGDKYCECEFGHAGAQCELSEINNLKCENPLGIQEPMSTIRDEQMASSSQVNWKFKAKYGRLLQVNKAWCGESTDANGYLEIRFDNVTMLNAVAMQGDPNGNNYVNEFKMHVKETSEAAMVEKMTFYDQHSDSNAINKHPIYPFLKAQHVRLVVVSFNGTYPCMRVELYGCPESAASAANCYSTLGIRDEALFPNTVFNGDDDIEDYEPPQGRLDSRNGWCTDDLVSPVIRVSVSQRDLEIVGVITQGRKKEGENDHWVTTYRIGLSDGSDIPRAAGMKIMSGNYDGGSYVTHFLDSPITLYYTSYLFKLNPKSWHVKPCMRFELIACDNRPLPCQSNPCLNGGECNRTETGDFCTCKPGFTGINCQDYEGGCSPAMDAPHEVVFASKKDDIDNYRMDSPTSWCTRDDDFTTPWLSMQFENVIKMYGFGIGASTNVDASYPSNFKVFTKLTDSDSWQGCRVKNTDWLPGVYKPGDVVYHYLDSPLEARQVKFEFHGHTAHPKCARVDIKGCGIDYCNDRRPCQNGATCVRSKKNAYLCHCPLGYEGKNCQFATKIGVCIPSLGVGSPAIIPDDRITAATAIEGAEPKYARLTEQVRAYCSQPIYDGTLTITFDSPTLVVGLQMRGHATEYHWVTKFLVRAAGQWLDFTGNTEQGDQTIWRHFFNNETSTQFSIIPIESNNMQCMRVELFGINEEFNTKFEEKQDTRTRQDILTPPTNRNVLTRLQEKWNCPRYGTLNRLTLADRDIILDSQFSANSFEIGYHPKKVRLAGAGWCTPAVGPSAEYLQINLKNFYKIEIIVTKGTSRSWVKSYYLDYSFDGADWTQAKIRDERRTLSGNFDAITPQYHFFEKPIKARLLKIIPEEWEQEFLCMHFDFLGCQFDPCESCDSAVSYCNETTSWTCKCLEGLEMDDDVCKDKCRSCNASTYCNETTDWNCTCIEGYEMDDGQCKDKCRDCRANTYCNKTTEFACKCIEGYERRDRICQVAASPNNARNTPNVNTINNINTIADGHPTVSAANIAASLPTPALTKSPEAKTLPPGYPSSRPPNPALGPSTIVPSRASTVPSPAGSCVSGNCNQEAIHGNWTNWTSWSNCSVSCGSGFNERTRHCSNPRPKFGGDNCIGADKETIVCDTGTLCPGEIGFGEWSVWSACNETCGPGQHTRSRECTIPNPGDSLCQGITNQTEECNLVPCPIDGGLTRWGSWSACSRTCDVGQRERTRSCTKPPPQYGGKDCQVRLRRLQDCEIIQCEGDYNYTEWSNWRSCSVTCDNGTRSKTRYCLDETGGGCTGPPLQTKECLKPLCPVDGNFTEWSQWSICSATCGSAVIHRTRECSNPEPALNGSDCLGLTNEQQHCSVPTICPHEAGFSLWTPWSLCDAQCSLGESTRERTCTDETNVTCDGTAHQNITCDAGPCPINGGYTDWDPWSPCTGYCGSGLQTRTRSCSNPEPAYNGAGCSGASEETQDCEHSTPCSGESGYEEWSEWTLCTQTCGNSIQIRTRKCRDGVHPDECSAESNQTKSCDKGPCPVHGNWASWSNWGVCSASCGSGVKERQRTCTDPVPSYGGLSCFENSHDYQHCVMPLDCPGDDEFSGWGNWGSCSVTCDEGTRTRSRYCTIVPSYPPVEEAYCTNPTEQTIECYNEPCLVNGNFTPWTDWSACTTSCGFGTRTRYRNCTNPPPLFDGSDCLGPLYEIKECENASGCPDDINFSAWADWGECSSGCEGTMYKTRECKVDEEDSCQSLTNATMDCQTQYCPENGGWSTWTPWSLCSKTCGHQEEARTRVCDNPVQRNGGNYCIGHDIEVMPCNEYDYIPCPDPPPAQWTDWSWWIPCGKACGGGHQERFRLCNNPPPAPGAADCVGEKNQRQDCNVHPCPVHGNFSEWSSWTDCTKDCGNGTQIRGRTCTNPRPAHNGDPCEGDLTQSGYCNEHHCPIDGGFTNWSPWMFCNKPCGIGTSDRKRSCTDPTPMYGGMNCTGLSFESNECNTYDCSPADIMLDVTFNAVTLSEYQNDVPAFQNTVTEMINPLYQGFPPAITFTSCDAGQNNAVRCRLNLNYQSVAKDELVVLQDKLLLPATQTTLNSMTSENVFSSPLSLQASASSSTSIRTEWPALPSSAETADTKSLGGYILFYKQTSADSYQKIGIAPAGSNLLETLEELKKFTPYRMVVCPYSSNGNGIPSEPVTVTTLEDVPSMAPVILNISSPSSTSLDLSWTTINDAYWHGIPQGYCVRYVARGSSVSDIHYVTNVTELETVLTNLNHFTRYYVFVSAKTTPGCGAEASTSFVTLEYVPSETPQNVNATSMTSSVGILVTWDEVRPEARHGVIRGYKVSYEKAGGAVKWKNVDGGDSREVNITGLQFLTEYKVKVLAYTSVGDGPESVEISVTTDESTPSRAPELVVGRNTNSSSIHLQWTTIDPQYHQGTLLGYRLYYHPAETKRKVQMIEIPDPTTLEYDLTDLFWWWWYDIHIAGYTRIGTGVTLNISVQTDEEIPSRYPENIRGVAVTTTSMSFEWDRILPGFVHGILIEYNLTVRETDNFDNVIVSSKIRHPERSYYIEGLKKYTNYTMWVSAINSKGEGPVYPPGRINSTGEDGPEFPPDDITASTLEHISEIKLEWTRIPPEYHNGILRGYYVEYTATVLAGEVVPTDKRVVQSKRIRGNRYATVLTDLDPGSTYEIKIFGYTIKNGTKSNITVAETCRCPKYLRSNWWVFPPYTNTSNPESPGGIFFMVARQVVDDMCGTCSNGHGQTEFCYEEGCDKKSRRRRSTSNRYQKNSLQSVSTSVGGNFEISFPVQGNKYMTTYAGVFPYISVVDAPGSAYFTVKNVPSTSEVVVYAALACLPLVLLMSFFAWIAGIIIWVLERKENNEHFPESFIKGVPEGFWWAYISMTTVGYGDRSPVTIPGRVFAIVWIMMGLVIISIVTGGIVTSISSVLVIQEDKIYGAQVGAIENSAEYSRAVRQNADVVPFNNMEELIAAMHNKEVAGALLDMYAAATKKSMFDGGDIQLNRLIEYPTGYGFVLSGNMAKAAPLFREALASKKTQISRIVEENTDCISQDRNEAEEAKEKSSGLFDPTADAFLTSFKVTISLLVVAIFVGLVWHFGRYRKKEKSKQDEKNELEESIPSFRVSEYLKSDGRQTLEEFTKSLEQKIASLKNKQIRERKNTWLFKTTRDRMKSTTSIALDIRKSTARVSPKVNTGENTGFADDEPPITSPRQSSLSSFYDYQRKKSSQVYPMKDHSSSQGYQSSDSLKEEEDSM